MGGTYMTTGDIYEKAAEAIDKLAYQQQIANRIKVLELLAQRDGINERDYIECLRETYGDLAE